MLKQIITYSTILVIAIGYNAALAKVQGIAPPVRHYTARTDVVTSKPNASVTGHAGVASYYADYFHGRKTANGERFDQGKLTAAHTTLLLGTVLKVVNKKTGKSVVVRINDRKPPSKVELDLSKAAFKKLSPLRPGLVNVLIYKIK